MKTLVVTIFLVLTAATPAKALESDPVRLFADCAGRLSAVIDFQWMFKGPDSERTQVQHAAVLELLDAVIAPDQGPEVLHWQLEAKHAQTVLLNRAFFNDDARDAAWAKARAQEFEQSCTSLLLI